MKLVTWNVSKDNKQLDTLVNFLKEGYFDVVCLQEFPRGKLSSLSTLNMKQVFGEERYSYSRKEETADLSLVILSSAEFKKYEVIEHENPYKNFDRELNHHYQTFKTDFLYVDLDFGGLSYRIFNSHLRCVAGPKYRISQFGEIIKHLHPERQNIICGDFNIFGKPLINAFVGNFCGYTKEELGVDEGKLFNQVFEMYGFKNVFKGSKTFTRLPFQLDYILVPYDSRIIDTRVEKNTFGSDHFPLIVELK